MLFYTFKDVNNLWCGTDNQDEKQGVAAKYLWPV